MDQPKTTILHPFRIYCTNCGAPARFDIVRQSYHCEHCGQTLGISETQKIMLQWKKLQKNNLTAQATGQMREEHSCPGCGAIYSFAPGEASATCLFCQNKLVRRELTDTAQLPEVIIPFFITPDEARERLLQWAQMHSKTPEGRAVAKNIDKLQCSYLPYRLLRGPVSAKVQRPGTRRSYECCGYLNGIAINTSKQLDNLLLNEVEPFDWTALKAFEMGYIAGHSVKLNDSSDQIINKRTQEETCSDFRPYVEKVMETTGVDIKVKTGTLFNVSALMPMYFIKHEKFSVVMNGQTGKIAASCGRIKTRLRGVWEPSIYTVGLTAISCYFLGYTTETVFVVGLFYTCVIFSAMSAKIGEEKKEIIVKSETAKSTRLDGDLHITEEKDILKNPYDNTPIFIEENEQCVKVPAKIKFYNTRRTIVFALNSLLILFLPILIAIPFRFAMMEPGEAFFDKFVWSGNAIWLCLTASLVMVYYFKGMRVDIYERPLVSEIMPNQELRPIKRANQNGNFSFITFFLQARTADEKGKKPGSLSEAMKGNERKNLCFVAWIMIFFLFMSICLILDLFAEPPA